MKSRWRERHPGSKLAACEPAADSSGGAADEAVTGFALTAHPEATARQRRSLLRPRRRALAQGARVDPAADTDQAPRRTRTQSVTRGGVLVTRTAEPFSPHDLGAICAQVDGRRGGVLSSGMEYPGRYSRWHLAYVNPCAEIVARGRRVTVRALNSRGEVLLPVLAAALRRAGEPTGPGTPRETGVLIAEPAGISAEEDRSRRPTVFSAVREVMASFA